jgi:hypothetical protein
MKRTRCRCGTEVDTFTGWHGLKVQIDTEPVPITADLQAIRHLLWEDRGPRVGWCKPFVPQRTWRELRTEHRCADTERKHESKRENTKENK